MIKNIVTVKENREFLSRKCVEVDVTENFVMADLIHDLRDTANSLYKSCAGLAANQIGYQYKAFAMKFGDKFIILINPKIVGRSDKTTISKEGCLSRPNKQPVMVRRNKAVKVEYYDWESNRVVTKKFKGFDAFVAQHEIDHGNGIII